MFPKKSQTGRTGTFFRNRGPPLEPRLTDFKDHSPILTWSGQKWNFGAEPAKILRFRTKRVRGIKFQTLGPGPAKISKFRTGPGQRKWEMVVSESSLTNPAMLVTNPKNRCNC